MGREYTLSRVNPRSRVFAAILGGTIVGPVTEVQIVNILDSYGLEIAIPSPDNSKRTSYILISRGNSRFVDELHIPNPNSDTALNYSLNIRRQKIANIAWRSRRPASRELVRHMLQDRLASMRLGLCSHMESFLRPKGSGKLFLPIHHMEELCQQRSSKWLQDWCAITIKMKDKVTQRFTGTR